MKSYFLDFLNGYLSHVSIKNPASLKRISKGEIMPGIQPVEEDKELKYALEVTSSPRDIKPDGFSTSEINAVLYSYIPGDQQSSKAVSGKNNFF